MPTRSAGSSCATTASWKSCRRFCSAMPAAAAPPPRLLRPPRPIPRRRWRHARLDEADMPSTHKSRRRLMGEINVVPYIDVMLVLLIIFMITAPLLTQGIKVDLPKAAAEALELRQNEPPLLLSIDAQGRLY